jgi:hypothetical protein
MSSKPLDLEVPLKFQRAFNPELAASSSSDSTSSLPTSLLKNFIDTHINDDKPVKETNPLYNAQKYIEFQAIVKDAYTIFQQRISASRTVKAATSKKKETKAQKELKTQKRNETMKVRTINFFTIIIIN